MQFARISFMACKPNSFGMVEGFGPRSVRRRGVACQSKTHRDLDQQSRRANSRICDFLVMRSAYYTDNTDIDKKEAKTRNL